MNPYVVVTYDGLVESDQNMKVVSTCKMDVHKFPFDTQSCSITVGSAIYSGEAGTSRLFHLLTFSSLPQTSR